MALTVVGDRQHTRGKFRLFHVFVVCVLCPKAKSQSRSGCLIRKKILIIDWVRYTLVLVSYLCRLDGVVYKIFLGWHIRCKTEKVFLGVTFSLVQKNKVDALSRTFSKTAFSSLYEIPSKKDRNFKSALRFQRCFAPSFAVTLAVDEKFRVTS